jgi:tRNA splicing endonuclease
MKMQITLKLDHVLFAEKKLMAFILLKILLIISKLYMKKQKKEISVEEFEEVMGFQNTFDRVDPWTIENMLENLQDKGYLSQSGKKFRSLFWIMFVAK